MEAKVKSNEIEDEKIHKICRLCGKESADYVPIFEENNHYIPEKISRCLSIIILPLDNLPSNICRCCLDHLNISYRLILTSVEVDNRLRMQIDQKQKNTTSKDLLFKDQYDAMSCEKSETFNSTNPGLLLRELMKQSVTGPIECDLCEMKFQDVDVFDIHMEQSHFLKWKCSLCDSSFYQSSEMITHKMLKHSNIVICNSCKHSNDQDDKWKIKNKGNVHNDQDKQRKIIENNDSREAVATFTVNEETATKSSINIAIEDNIIPMQTDLAKQSDTSDSDIDRIINNCNKFLEKFKVFKHKENECLFCDICNIHFTEDRYFKAHNEIHEERSVICTVCCIKCSSVYELFLHKRAVHNLYKDTLLRYTCNKCNKFFTKNWHWERHNEDTCFDPEYWKFKCTICDQSFRDKVRLREHYLIIHGNKRYQCDICGRYFSRRWNMMVHRKIHVRHKCSYCDTGFKKRQDLIKHMQESHSLEPDVQKLFNKTYICKYCGKKLNSSQSLMNHERVHTGEMPFSCPMCQKSFRTYITMWTHLQRHEKGNFLCEYCGKCFSYKKNLYHHLRTHSTGVEAWKYQCNICGKKFLRNFTLSNHKRIHTKIPYKCDVCSSSFTQKSGMKRHRMRHFKCIDIQPKTAESEKQA